MGTVTTIQSPADTSGGPQKPAAHQEGAQDPKEGEFTTTATGGVTPTNPQQTQQQPATTDQQVERPDYIPEKFWDGNLESSTKKMSASYNELESKTGKQSQQTDTQQTDTGQVDQQQQQATRAQVSDELFAEAQEEWAERNGSLSPAMYDKLAEAGIPAKQVNQYIRGQEALSASRAADLAKLAGSQERLNEAVEWAAGEFSEAEIAEFNSAVNDGENAARANMAVELLMNRYEANGGSQIVAGAAPGQGGIQPFKNREEMLRAQADKRYRTDRTYEQEVTDRIAASMQVPGFMS